MIQVTIPHNNISERKYIINIILVEFLGLDIEIVVNKSCNNWTIKTNNGSMLYIEDHFFNQFPRELEYLKFENIPNYVEYIENDFAPETNIPLIYGTPNLDVKTNNIFCGIDIFASCFFMLTRWEEYANENRDKHNRFSAKDCIAYKFNFLNRPVVNEYTEMLKNMLLHLDNKIIFKKRDFSILLTHDVDVPLKYSTWHSGLIEIVGDILKRRDIRMATYNLIQKIKTHAGWQPDPYDTFDYLMDISEKLGVKSYFFFMGRGVTKSDNKYKSNSSFIKELVTKIKDRGHLIGMHPTYNAYNDNEQFMSEKKELEINLNVIMAFGREHVLRFEVPTTWQIWEDNKMLWDSTMSYADCAGFRCGVCYEYSVYNILSREKLSLKEKPLIVMEGSFLQYQIDTSPRNMELEIDNLIQKIKKYNGEFVFLWHNSSFKNYKWLKYQHVYENILNKLNKEAFDINGDIT